jgi:hypothetical protein
MLGNQPAIHELGEQRMAAPRLTFFCELDTGPLQALFDETSTLADLQALNARLSLGVLEFSPERAALVRRLNQAGIPVAAWLLLPKEQGYWLNLDNVNHAVALYEQFQGWTAEHGLQDGAGRYLPTSAISTLSPTTNGKVLRMVRRCQNAQFESGASPTRRQSVLC